MQFHQLKRIHPNKSRMTVARGGKRGKTAGRGGKGQSARAGNKRRPEWRDIIKRLPKLRGRGVSQNKPVSDAFVPVNLSVIEAAFSAGDMVTPAILAEKGIIDVESGRIPAVKILGDGEITKAVKISGCAISASAKEKVEKAKGEITPIPSRVIKKNPGAAGITGTPAVAPAAPKKAAKAPKADKAPKAEKAPKADKPAKEAKEKKAPAKKAAKE